MTRTNYLDLAYKKYMSDSAGLYTPWEIYLKASGYADAILEHNGKIDAISTESIQPKFCGFISTDSGAIITPAKPSEIGLESAQIAYEMQDKPPGYRQVREARFSCLGCVEENTIRPIGSIIQLCVGCVARDSSRRNYTAK